MKILLAIDGSSYTKQMLAYLVENKELFANAAQDYTVMTVIAPLPTRVNTALSKEVILKYYADESDKITEPVVKFLAMHDIHPTVVSKVGVPGQMIAQVAEEGKFRLVVMGSHGHGALGNLVMGSVATQVLANCKVPVLLVR